MSKRSPDGGVSGRLPFESMASPDRSRIVAHFILALVATLVVSGALLLAVRATDAGQFLLLLHAGLGLVAALPVAVFVGVHWRHYWPKERGGARWVSVATTFVLGGLLLSGLWLLLEYALAAVPGRSTVVVHRLATFTLLVLLPLHLGSAGVRRADGVRRWRRAGAVLGLLALLPIGADVLFRGSENDRRWQAIPADYPRTPDGGVFSAALTTTARGEFIAVDAVTGSAACGECHAQIFEEWSSSVHRFSGVDNPLIAAAVLPAEAKGGLAAARFCAACHEPVAMLAGRITTSAFDAGADVLAQGVTCLTCHGIRSVPTLHGNGSMVFDPPDTFAFFNADDRVGRTLNRILVHGFVEEHRAAMRPAVLSNSHQCSSCHTVNAHESLNGVGFIRLHNENDDWRVSAFAAGVADADGHRSVVRCQDCHMPLVDGSEDPVAGRRGGRHRSHRFAAANTFVAKHFGDEEQFRLTEAFLRGEGVPAEIRDYVPSGPAVSVSIDTPRSVVPGATVQIAVELMNRGVGHAFPAGPNEVNEAWVEVVAREQGGVTLLHSGALNAAGERDPDAFALVSVPVDVTGAEVHTTAGLSAGFRLRRAILHGARDRHSYSFGLPRESLSPAIEIEARLLYRKADAPFARLLDGFDIGDVPITEVSAAQAVIEVVPGQPERPVGSETLAAVPAAGAP